MTDAESFEHDEGNETEGRGSGASSRGSFQVFHTPVLDPPPTAEALEEVDLRDDAAAYFAHEHLLDGDNEREVVEALEDLAKAVTPGSLTTPLLVQDGPDGMSLYHVWFAPNFRLFRHSHPGAGDCLYYVVAGELALGSHTLGPGSGFFVPNGMPYKYRAGPEGAEVLEFRSGGGIPGAPMMKLDERSVDSIRQIAAANRSMHTEWAAAERAPGGALFDPQAQRRAGSKVTS